MRFVTDLTIVDFTNKEAERTISTVKVPQRSSGGWWRTLVGLAQFAVVDSCPIRRRQMEH